MSSQHPSIARGRLADRVDCRVPIRIRAGGYTVHAETENLSRVGALLRIPLKELQLAPGASLCDIGNAVKAIISERSSAEFRYDELGGLVSRSMRLIRIARQNPDDPHIDIGFALRRPITDEETGFLRVDLPPVRRVRATVPEGVGIASDAPELQMVVCATAGGPAQPMLTQASDLDATGVAASLRDISALPMCGEPTGVLTVLGAIADGYTCSPTVVLMRDERPLWSGPTQIRGVHLEETGGLEMKFAFSPALGAGELARLGTQNGSRRPGAKKLPE